MDLIQLKKSLNKNPELIFSKLGMDYEKFSENIYSKCPIHEGSDNPRAFSYSIKKSMWKCWTRDCQLDYRNDIFGLIQGVLSSRLGHEVEFKEVLKWINSNVNIKASGKRIEQIEDLYEDFHNIVKTFSIQQQSNEDKSIDEVFDTTTPSKYFMSRGFESDTMNYFGVGDCDTSCQMKDRALIPIHNLQGDKVVGIIGRATNEYRIPKFIFYPTGFNKNQYLYNYHKAVEHIHRTNSVIVVEGQGDVWKLHEAGVRNVVSIFGKSISQKQEEILQSLPVTTIVVLTDNDQAGRESKIEIFRKLNRMFKLVFPKIKRKDIGEMKVENIRESILPQIKGLF